MTDTPLPAPTCTGCGIRASVLDAAAACTDTPGPAHPHLAHELRTAAETIRRQQWGFE